jgi:hypothetical protein
VVDRSDDASCLLGLAGLAVERVVLTGLGVKIVQLVTDDPEAMARRRNQRVLIGSPHSGWVPRVWRWVGGVGRAGRRRGW